MATYTHGVLVRKSTGQSIPNASFTPLTWESEDYDDGGWHDAASNPSRLTVPSDVTLIKLFCGVQFAPRAGNDRGLRTTVNGAPAPGCPSMMTFGPAASNRIRYSFMGPPLVVTPGDYLELEAFVNGGALDVEADQNTFFGAVAMEPATRRAMVRLTSDQAQTSLLRYVDWEAAEYDTDGFWSAGSPSRLTIPSGVSLVRLYAGFRWQNIGASTSSRFINIDKNGTSIIGGGAFEPSGVASASTPRQAIQSAPLAVTPGDYFEVQARTGDAADILADPETYFAIEVLA